MGEIEIWNQYGLSGIVIFALFTVIYFIVKQHRALILFLVKEHKEERSEWIAAYTQQSQDTNAVIRELTAVTRALSERRRYDD